MLISVNSQSFLKRITSKENWTWQKNSKRLITLLMAAIIVIMLFPLFLIVNNSFKGLRPFLKNPLALPNPFIIDNYKYVFQKVNYFRLLLNNIVVIAGSLVLIVLFGGMAGFTIARRPSKLKKAIYIYIILGITLPVYTMLYPQIKLINDLNLDNNYLGLILLYTASGMSMSIFLYNGFYSGASKELEESAKIDGASFVRTYFQIYFPLSLATTSTLVLLQSISMWNDTTLPALVMVDSSFRTLMTELNTFFGAMVARGTRWERVYAFSALCMLPMVLLFSFVNKFLISGVAEGALKG